VPPRKLKKLGRYRILGEIGRGAMGVVYKAHDPVLDRTVALKVIALDDDVEEREEYEARFFQEAKAAARLNHPALITIYDFGEEDDLAYMAMELLDGTELGERLAKQPPTVREAVAIAEQVAEGLAFAHDNGVVHRDIKPGNIMLLPRGRAKIMDFGVARLKVSDLKTQTGTRLGTPKYMSPEQVGGRAVDHRSDIFSLGIVLYEMLTGAQLFRGEDVAQVMHNVTSFEPPPPSRVNGEIPPLLDLVVKRALEKKPAARYPNAWEMVTDLHNCLLEIAPETAAAETGTGRSAPERVEVDDHLAKTAVLKPATDGSLVTRRMRSDVDTANRLPVSPRFDSAPGLGRLNAPAARDRHRLAHTPREPGLLRRLWHDRALAWMTVTLAVAIVIAAAVALG
jgi:serine/threonine-protein kinase